MIEFGRHQKIHSAISLSQLGGKARTLVQLSEAGFPVPPGVAVSSEHCTDALRSLPEKSSDINLVVEALLKRAPDSLFQDLLDAVRKFHAPYGYAVRSSASEEDGKSRSFAGIYETVLGVPFSAIPSAICKVWASVLSNRASSYHKLVNSLVEESSMGVIVQGMINPRAAGVVFTINPVAPEAGTMLIEAVYGLGDGLVSGRIQPDAYEVDRHARKERSVIVALQALKHTVAGDGTITETEVLPEEQHARKLDFSDVEQLVEVADRIENLMGAPQDIEFAFDQSGLHILQTRPLTSRFPDARSIGGN